MLVLKQKGHFTPKFEAKISALSGNFLKQPFNLKAWFPYDRPDRPSRFKNFRYDQDDRLKDKRRVVAYDVSWSDNGIFARVSQISQT